MTHVGAGALTRPSDSLSANPIQRFLRPGKSLGHRKCRTVFLGGSLLVALFFERGTQEVMGFEGGRLLDS